MRIKKTTFALAIVLIAAQFAPEACFSSEEDFATVSEVQMTVKTNCKDFGVVKLIAKQREDGLYMDSLQVTFGGKTYSVPADELKTIGQIDPATIRISSEIGYPKSGIGPYLYCTIQSIDSKTKHRLLFSPTGFKERAK